MYAVKTLYNTGADGGLVPANVPEEEMPTTYHGPFASQEEAVHWMNEIYPDGDIDVYDQFADDYDIPVEWLNDPNSISV